MTEVISPTPRTILAVDIKGFGGHHRRDLDRTVMRTALKGMLRDTATKVFGDENRFILGDTGDGGFLVIDPLVPKTDVLISVVPALERAIRIYNNTASDSSTMALRIAVHSGDVLIEADSGVSGETLNHTFRLLDCIPLRQALDQVGATTRLIVSDRYYNEVVTPGWAGSPADAFLKVTISNKETNTIAWLRQDHLSPGPTDGNDDEPLGPDGLRRMTLGDLAPTSLYIAISDIHNYSLYGRDVPVVPLINQIETAILLAPQVIMHCADPFRKVQVADAIREFPRLLDESILLFLMGENAVDPSTHFRPYIDLKVDQYRRSTHGARDVDSLTKVDSEAFARANDLLKRSTVSLVRGFSGTDRFIELVLHDLSVSEKVVSYEPLSGGFVRHVDLTLRQLLQLEQMKASRNAKRVVATDKGLEELQASVRSAAQDRSFSRQILMSLIDEALPSLQSNGYVRTRIEERVSILHLRGTVGDVTYLPVTSESDRRSPFYYGCLLDHMGQLVNRPHPQRIGPVLTMALRADPQWPLFAAHHERAMMHLQVRRRRGEPHPTDVARLFGAAHTYTGLDSIREKLEKAWL